MKGFHISFGCISFDSYIKPQPVGTIDSTPSRCISFDSYIKPQLVNPPIIGIKVVYLLIPTSNHNSETADVGNKNVVYLLIPTSNHNSLSGLTKAHLLYIF